MAISKDVTISEIAARADVSIATVSRVINQIGNTKAETKQRVFQAMSELGLNPNTYCGAKDTAGSQSILVCLPDFRNPFNADVIEGIQNAAITHGYRTFFTKHQICAFLYMNMKKSLIRIIFAVCF